MAENRVRYGSFTATVGAALLAVSVFLPWYGISFTASGVAYAQQQLDDLATQFGNSTLQSQVGNLHAGFTGLAGQQFATLTAHQALKYINVVLLILAAVSFLSALLRLAGAWEPPASGGDPIALVGAVAALCVVFRMVDPPVPTEGFVSFSLGGGIWLALGSSVAIVLGSLWSRHGSRPNASAAGSDSVWDGFSGWTPDV